MTESFEVLGRHKLGLSIRDLQFICTSSTISRQWHV